MIESTVQKACSFCKSEKTIVLGLNDHHSSLIHCRVWGVVYKVDHEVKDRFDQYLRNKWVRDELKRIIDRLDSP